MIYNWYKIEQFSFTAMQDNTLMEIGIAGKRIGLLKRASKVYAFTAACPHAGAPLCEGWLDAQGHIVCPLHKYHYDPVNGRNVSGEGYKLFTYPTEIRGNEIFIGILST